ncbi:variant erythrocyte surface antigen-1 family protein [Babesia caballi]|uniref:Variant erythrocyte surface antigen-1 family protein n=1 Tax=Babesia caballi TaxID=5871 RepID=A0AAV4LNA5_BABCB|nr:variant erythrocyte surface antigen-1 family protein [Babesia caballi]
MTCIPLSASVELPLDCPSNLKEAIDWILRVTGNDGQTPNNDGTAALSTKVKELLKDVEESDTKIGGDIKKVKNALQSNGDTLITKLADGLQQFIGYDGRDGRIEADKGIAVSNLPVERLRDAVLMFIAPFLGVLRYNHPQLMKHTEPFNKAITACKNGVGCGKEAFETALETVEKEMKQVSSSLIGDIKNVLEKVKDVSAIKSNHTPLSTFADKVKEYFNNVLQKVVKDNGFNGQAASAKTQIENLNTHLQTLVGKVGQQVATSPINVGDGSSEGQQTQGLQQYIDKVNNGNTGALKELYKKFPDRSSKPKAYALSAAAYNGANLFVTVLQTDYTSYYKDATWQNVSGENPKKCAKILLACLPLIFNGLSYFYWKCSDTKGWKNMTLGSPEPKAFMGLTSIGANRVKSGRTGSDIVSQAFQNFKEFTNATSNATSYADFLKKFRGNCLTTWQTSQTAKEQNFLSGLYLCSTSYFRHQHQKNAAQARPPSSIREMLYFVAALQLSSAYNDIAGHIDTAVPNDLSVADSSLSANGNTLSVTQLKGYLRASCLDYCP